MARPGWHCLLGTELGCAGVGRDVYKSGRQMKRKKEEFPGDPRRLAWWTPAEPEREPKQAFVHQPFVQPTDATHSS